MRALCFLISVFMLLLGSPGADAGVKCPIREMAVERLPDMNVPRIGHAALWLDGELTVFGGHTNGFVPTPTAEYFRDGQWTLMQMAYPHDNALILPLSSGKVLLGGGHSEPLGIGQTFPAEFYDPATRSFDGFGCLDTKRTFAGGVELDSGQVLISGNWYHDDGIELFDGQKLFSPVGQVAMPRAVPYMLHVAPDDVVIFSSCDTRGAKYDSIVADRLKGAPFHIPLFDTWHPVAFCTSHSEENFQTGDYTYLLLACNDSSQVGIVKMRGTTFSLLPTATPIPTTDGSDSISYAIPIVDRQRQRYYVMGTNRKDRLYVLCVDYTRQPAPLTLYRTAPMQEAFSEWTPVLTPEGDIIVTGGIDSDNFHPFASVYRLSLAQSQPVATAASQSWTGIVAALLAAGVLLVCAYIIYIKRRRQLADEPAASEQPEEEGAATLKRIRQLMEQEQLYLNSELKVGDIADRLGLHRNQVSDCINTVAGTTFSQLVANYRVEHAKQLLRQHPDMKIAAVGTESGFANEKSFFRTFKTLTGKTPSEWRAQGEA